MKTCQKPDRHVPALKCGHPLPCPWHTAIVDLEEDSIMYPSKTSEKTKKRVEDIKESLKELKR